MAGTQEQGTAAGMSGGSARPPADGQVLLTRYLMFETDDSGQTLRFLGTQDAKNSDEALRQFHGPDTTGTFAAVSENHFKLRPLAPRKGPVVGQPVAWPDAPAVQADEPDPAAASS